MKNWKKPSLITALILLIVIFGAIYMFDINVSLPSSDIEFSPGQTVSKVEPMDSVQKPENIIVFIADGMGFSHLSLALLTQQEENTSSVWQEFDVKGWHDARSVYGPITDSEASATAMATGISTNFGYVGLDPDGNPVKNLMELASENGYLTAIVTDSYIWDGTPAAFSSHTNNEDDARDILTQIAESELDLVFGELEDLGEGLVPEEDETLEILRRRFHLLDKSLELPSEAIPIAAIFDEDEVQDMESSPNLVQLTTTALTYLSSQDKPFVLLVESEEMDAASHANDSDRVVRGLKPIQQTLSQVLSFSKSHGQTLVVFTADHETGGMAAVADFGDYPNMQIRWTTRNHSGAVVPLFADGPGAEGFADVHRNWEIGLRLKSLISERE